MIDYETYCRIRDLHTREGLKIAQIAQALGLHSETVSKWLRAERYRRRQAPPRPSKLDPYKPQIRAWLEAHPLTAQQILQRLRERGVGLLNPVEGFVEMCVDVDYAHCRPLPR